MKSYLKLLEHVLENGVKRDDRTGTGTRSVFGHQARFRLDQTFPLLTTKKLHLRSIIYELLWFLNGDTNVKYLQEMASAFGTNGPMKMESLAAFMERSGPLGKSQMENSLIKSIK